MIGIKRAPTPALCRLDWKPLASVGFPFFFWQQNTEGPCPLLFESGLPRALTLNPFDHLWYEVKAKCVPGCSNLTNAFVAERAQAPQPRSKIKWKP